MHPIQSRHVADTPSASFQYHSRWSQVWLRKNDTLMLVNEVSIDSQEYMYAVPGSKVSRWLLAVYKYIIHYKCSQDRSLGTNRINFVVPHKIINKAFQHEEKLFIQRFLFIHLRFLFIVQGSLLA